ncbi:hypothetical protein ACN23B_17445 [Anabaena sp. FACHB-709]|nr:MULTISPECIES: hypothetical protein [Nostocaceae]HBW32980.1 hypothetical protein [Nostoc sp. UBA8866]MBD2174299.1 hypothetical protein [Anabaena cylindrica FACHB-318]MBD2263595.1 hypothetical protein [Anabaena sp. FACHB-709]MBD2275885.1 hypothetical protein [Nostoc sp. PCC 7120 = FACHB-418]MBD2286696.1 hypothetical protein [Anabaena cylindrica FACHB-170]
MKLESFFDNFELLTDAPNASAKLRDLILQLAVKGKLVNQDLNDESASILLENVQAQKEKITGGRKIEKENFLLEIEEKEYFYNIPPKWIYTRLENISFF